MVATLRHTALRIAVILFLSMRLCGPGVQLLHCSCANELSHARSRPMLLVGGGFWRSAPSMAWTSLVICHRNANRQTLQFLPTNLSSELSTN